MTDTSEILQRVERLWSLSMQGQAASVDDTYFLASTLRTALKDTEQYKQLYSAACDWFNFGPPHQIDETDPGSIVTKDGNYEPFTQALEDAVSAIAAAMSPNLPGAKE